MDGAGVGKDLGTNPNKLAELRSTGNNLSIVTNKVNLTNVAAINAYNGSKLQLNTHTAADVPVINIGQDGVGAATITLDTNGQANVNLLNGVNVIAFKHADSLRTHC